MDLEKAKAKDRATAISYAWGEFERTTQLIGHDSDGNDISITLGEEWNIVDFTNRLVLLSFERGACWIDQLCIPQKDAEIRKALASIPTIYRTLDVVVLMPGAPCKCLRERLKSLRDEEALGNSENYASTVVSDVMSCLNFINCSSWFNRVWTRQELLYSRRICVAWTVMTDAPCVRMGGQLGSNRYATVEQAADLSPFARLLHQKTTEEMYSQLFGPSSVSGAVKRVFQTGNPAAIVDVVPGLVTAFADRVFSIQVDTATERGARLSARRREIRQGIATMKERWAANSALAATTTLTAVQFNYFKAAVDAFKQYLGRYDNGIESEKFACFKVLQFFAGETIESGLGAPNLTDEKVQLRRFLEGLGRLRTSARTSTQARDYVNSVWVDCPKFQVPVKYKMMDLPALIDDALFQLQGNHEATIATAAPAGLFGCKSGTALWKPSLYLLKAAIENEAQVYGPILYPFEPVCATKEGMIPLRFTGAGYLSLSSMAVDYESQCSRLSTHYMFDKMSHIVALWSPGMYERAQRVTPPNQILADYEKDSKNVSIVGKVVAHSLSTAASNIVRGSFGLRDNFAESQRETLRHGEAGASAQRQGRIDQNDFRSQLLNCIAARHKTNDWGSRAEVKHFEIVYQLVADVLGLEYKMCRSRGLRLMISTDPPCIGIANRKVHNAQAKMQTRDASCDLIKTICMTEGESVSGNRLYEVEKVAVKGSFAPPQYRVFGVWVPMIFVSRDWIHAVAETGATDGYIV
jgi:hypothetical protein